MTKSLAASVLGVSAAALLLYFTRKRKSTPTPTPTPSSEILAELTEAVHEVLTEMAQMATRVRQVLAMKGMSGQISDQEISDIIMSQGIAEKLETVQNRILSKHGISESEILKYS